MPAVAAVSPHPPQLPPATKPRTAPSPPLARRDHRLNRCRSRSFFTRWRVAPASQGF